MPLEAIRHRREILQRALPVLADTDHEVFVLLEVLSEVLLQDGEGDEAKALEKARRLADEARAKLKVAAWTPATAVTVGDKGELRAKDGSPIGNLEVKTRKGKAPKGGACDEPFAPLLLRLTMYFLDDEKPYVVFEEKKLAAKLEYPLDE